MTRVVVVVVAAGLAAALAPARAAAEPALLCAARGQPVPVAVRDTGFDAGRGACLARELSIRVEGVAAIDTPEFYGTIAAAGVVGFALPITDRIELGVAAHGLRYTFTQDAVVKATELGAGPLVAHVAYAGASPDPAAARWAAIATVAIPFTDVGDGVTTIAGQLAIVRSMAVRPRWVVHTRAAVLGAIAGSAGGSTRRGAFLVGIDAVVAATGRLSLGLGADAQAGWRGAFDQFLLRPGLRVRARGRLHVELGAGLALGGRERVDAAVTLGVVVAN